MRGKTLAAAALFIMLSLSGCDGQVPVGERKEVPKLVKVEIKFENGEALKGYLQDLKLGDNSVVYVGGSSVTPLYDVHGSQVGIFNYNRVLYIRVIP